MKFMCFVIELSTFASKLELCTGRSLLYKRGPCIKRNLMIIMRSNMERPQATIQTRRLTLEMVNHLSDGVCSICQSAFCVRQFVIGVSCGHGFHRECFERWIQEVRLIRVIIHGVLIVVLILTWIQSSLVMSSMKQMILFL